MAKIRGLGSTIRYAPAYNSADGLVKLVGALTSIGEISPNSDELDITTLDSTGGYREFIQGFKDSGEIALAGYHDISDTGQSTMRTLYDSGASGYFWVTFPDATCVAFTAYVKSYQAGAAEVDGIVGFGATIRVTGLVQVVTTKEAVAQTKTAGQTATLDATAVVVTGTPSYQWYTNTTNTNVGGSIISGATSATYTTPALTSGTKYYYCVVNVANYRPVPSQVFVVVVT